MSNRRIDPSSGINRVLAAAGIFLVLIVLIVIGRFVSPEFLTTRNLLSVLHVVTLLGIVATGVAFITYSGHYVDLSIPAIMALSGFVTITALPLGIVLAVLCGLLAGLVIGIINGYVVGYMRLNPIIWTLAMAFMLDGVLRWIYSGNQVYPDDTTTTGVIFVQLARHNLSGHLPSMSALMILLMILCHILMKHTRFGTAVQLTGSAYEVAKTSGVNVKRIVLGAFAISSLATATAGILLASLAKNGTFDNGKGYDFNAVTAVVLGGIALAGGKGSIVGLFGGVVVIGFLGNIMALIGWGYDTQLIVKGLVFITVVAITSFLSRRSGVEDE